MKELEKKRAYNERVSQIDMVCLYHWFFQFIEVWGGNEFIHDYLIYCQRNMIYQNR